jgi:6,7-dimethyl-8-ribityllumazine synthase
VRLSGPSMSLDAPALSPVDGAPFSFGVAAACFNAELVEGLLASLRATLSAGGVRPDRIEVVRVPGSHEAPYAAQLLAASGRHDCVIALGVLIGGDTNHHEMVGNSVSMALQQLSLAARLPVINGVIVANTRAQAEARCLGAINRGAEFARAALAMAALKTKFSR